MHTLVQDGITPLTETQMDAVVRSVEVFLMSGARGKGPIRFDLLAEIMREAVELGAGRQPTQLEIMAACCTLETRGNLRFDFIGGLLHISSPCA